MAKLITYASRKLPQGSGRWFEGLSYVTRPQARDNRSESVAIADGCPEAVTLDKPNSQSQLTPDRRWPPKLKTARAKSGAKFVCNISPGKYIYIGFICHG